MTDTLGLASGLPVPLSSVEQIPALWLLAAVFWPRSKSPSQTP